MHKRLPSLFTFERLDYLGDFKYVDIITSLKDKSIDKFKRTMAEKNMAEEYKNIKEFFSDTKIPEEISHLNPKQYPVYEKLRLKAEDIILDSNKNTDHIYLSTNLSQLDIKKNACSITGGITRNILMGEDLGNTDIDVAGSDRELAIMFGMFYDIDNESPDVPSFLTEDNHIHLLNSFFDYFTYEDGTRIKEDFHHMDYNLEVDDVLRHTFVNPHSFDFTINCACISSEDGYMYAPPITQYDIENKILRSPLSVSHEDNFAELFNISTSIRAIRFMHKYDMTLHKNVYNSVVSFFSMQRERKTTGDYSMFLALRHLYDESESLRNAVFKTMKDLKAYETDMFSNIDDYYSYISSKQASPRQQSFQMSSNFARY